MCYSVAMIKHLKKPKKQSLSYQLAAHLVEMILVEKKTVHVAFQQLAQATGMQPVLVARIVYPELRKVGLL